MAVLGGDSWPAVEEALSQLESELTARVVFAFVLDTFSQWHDSQLSDHANQ
jgi:hypothetical protein